MESCQHRQEITRINASPGPRFAEGDGLFVSSGDLLRSCARTGLRILICEGELLEGDNLVEEGGRIFPIGDIFFGGEDLPPLPMVTDSGISRGT